MTIGIIDLIVRIALVATTTLLFAIVFAAYLRLKNRRLLFISVGFGIFFVHALLTIPELFLSPAYVIDENTHLLIHAVSLIFILLGTLKE